MVAMRFLLSIACPAALLVALGVVPVAGCGAGDYGAESGSSDKNSDPSPGGQGSPGSAGSGGSVALPPEEELESSFLSPVATGRFVWVANPTSGRVAFIDATTLEVRLVEAGNGPSLLAPLPADGVDRAIVLNTLSLDATILTASDSSLEAQSLPVPSGGNAWAISPSGRFAVAWTDARKQKDPDPLDGFQDLTVLDLQKGTSSPLAVGYRPVAVSFAEDESRAFVVTQDGVAVVALSEASVVEKNLPLTDTPQKGASTRDVAITPDGSLALVRLEGATAVTIVKLADGTRSQVELGGVVTDLDLSPDGKVAVAVVREKGKIALLRVPDIGDDAQAFSELVVGSSDNVVGSAALAEESSVAFLYSNAASNPLLTVVDLGADKPEARGLLLRAPVGAVFPTRDAASALVVHTKGPEGSKTSYKSALSVVRVASELPAKILGLESPVVSVAVSIEGGIGEGAGRGYVAQKHPEGRLSFIDLESGEVRTITGFELAAQVVYGDKKK